MSEEIEELGIKLFEIAAKRASSGEVAFNALISAAVMVVRREVTYGTSDFDQKAIAVLEHTKRYLGNGD